MKTKMIKVRWLKHHSNFAYAANKVGFVYPEDIKMLTEDEDPYIEILPDDYEEPVIVKKVVPESEMIKARVIKDHPGFVWKIGSIGTFTPDDAIILLQDDYIEPLPFDYQEEQPAVIKIVPESEMIEGLVLKSHRGFIYNVGDIGRFTPDDYERLKSEGYVQEVPKNNKLKTTMIEKLKKAIKNK